MPEAVASLLAREQLMAEILYPMHWGRDHEYPFPEFKPGVGPLKAA
jgi:hypothetical protein